MDEQITQALEVLKRGGIILYPTDTVWGIGCDAANAEAVGRIYALKQRDDRKSMILLIDRPESAARYVQQVPDIAWELWDVADQPLTLVLPQGRGVADNLLPAERTLALRPVRSLFCQKLIRRLGHPLVSTSANVSGQPTPASFAAISETIRAGVDLIADPAVEEGATGKASSIIQLGPDGQINILRP